MQRLKKCNSNSAMGTKKNQLVFWCIVLMGKQSVEKYLMRTVAVYSSYLWFALNGEFIPHSLLRTPFFIVFFFKFCPSLTFWTVEHESKLNILGSVWTYTYHLADINTSDKCEFIIEFEHFIEPNINCSKFVFANHKLSNRQFIQAIKTSF